MKSKKGLLLAGILVLVLLAGAAVVFLSPGEKKPVAEEKTEDTGVRTFADWTDVAELRDVPALIAPNTRIGKALDYGANNYVIDIEESSLQNYKDYLVLLEKNGFEKHVDNGEDGLADAVYTTTYTKGDLVLTVTHMVNIEKTYISACFDQPLSKHLFYNESYVADNVAGAQTKIHMLELYDYGNSFIIEMKNGKFIVMDGGKEEDGKYLLDYLETLVPEGEKPVIEAWILSHAHIDHVGALAAISRDEVDASRIYIEGIYFNEPSDSVLGAYEPAARTQVQNVNMAPIYFKTTSGMRPQIYRTQTGQKYYFNDIVIDIVMAQEQMLLTNYSGDLNDSSTWLMLHIDGQKALFGGDGEVGGMKNIMRAYGEDYMVFEIFQALHHSLNTREDFTDYCTTSTVLTAGPELRDTKANAYLAESVDEVIAWGDGSKVLTFPYKVGTYKDLPNLEWIYNPDRDAELAE